MNRVSRHSRTDLCVRCPMFSSYHVVCGRRRFQTFPGVPPDFTILCNSNGSRNPRTVRRMARAIVNLLSRRCLCMTRCLMAIEPLPQFYSGIPADKSELRPCPRCRRWSTSYCIVVYHLFEPSRMAQDFSPRTEVADDGSLHFHS